ncbi:bile acid:sodium symporter family protein [soil metagenome]
MTLAQLTLSLVLATMVFSVALDLRVADFTRVAHRPRAVICGLVPQFVLLPVGTWLATLVLDLPPAVEAAMLLVAACPGGTLSNVVTHVGRGNTALSVSISAISSVMALFLTPFNFTWMMATNPSTAHWMSDLSMDPSEIWWSLLGLLAVPMALGLSLSQHFPKLAAAIRKPLGAFSLAALLALIALGLYREREVLGDHILPQLVIVVVHNASGLLLGFLCALVFRLRERDRRAVMIEGGMQNSGLALGIIAVQFDNDRGMVIIASLWGIWHIVSGLALALWWRRKDALISI